MDVWQGILLAGAAVVMGYSLFQGVKSRRNLASGDSISHTQSIAHEIPLSARRATAHREVRARDYSREVEARIDNRLAVLDQLIVDADREIEQLQMLLHQSAKDRELTSAEQQRCFALQEAGCSTDEIARCLNAATHRVQAALDQWHSPTRRAA